MSQAMSIMEYAQLCDFVLKNNTVRHSANNVNGKRVKYIDATTDFRTGAVFSVKLRGFGWEQCFHVMNEQRDLPGSLKDRIMLFLTSSND